jgi:hypothetical protein
MFACREPKQWTRWFAAEHPNAGSLPAVNLIPAKTGGQNSLTSVC